MWMYYRDSLVPKVKKREADCPYAAPRPTYKNIHSLSNHVNVWKADALRRGQFGLDHWKMIPQVMRDLNARVRCMRSYQTQSSGGDHSPKKERLLSWNQALFEF